MLKDIKATKLTIGSKVYSIKQSTAYSINNNLGQVEMHKRAITLNFESDKHKFIDEILDTYLHEIMHVVFAHSSLNDDIEREQEEKIVTSLSTSLTEVLIRNPDILKDINKLANKARKVLQ